MRDPFRTFELADMVVDMTQRQVNDGAIHRADIGWTSMYEQTRKHDHRASIAGWRHATALVVKLGDGVTVQCP